LRPTLSIVPQQQAHAILPHVCFAADPEINVIPDIENGPDFLPIGSCKPSSRPTAGWSLDEGSQIPAGIWAFVEG
jgi:hypothetical protein